jgi:hypothetical protein
MRDEASGWEDLSYEQQSTVEPQRSGWRSTSYIQACPACGRQLMIRIEYLGHEVACRHCRRRFTANDPHASKPQQSDSAELLLNRANALLAKCEAQNGQG